MKLTVSHYYTENDILASVMEFETVEEFVKAAVKSTETIDQGCTSVYRVNSDIFLIVSQDDLVIEANLDVVQKYKAITDYFIIAYPKKETSLLLNMKKNLSVFCNTTFPRYEEKIEMLNLNSFLYLDFGYEMYDNQELTTEVDIRIQISNLDNTRLFIHQIPPEGTAKSRINLRPVDDLQSYGLTLSSTILGFIFLIPYSTKLNTELLCRF